MQWNDREVLRDALIVALEADEARCAALYSSAEGRSSLRSSFGYEPYAKRRETCKEDVLPFQKTPRRTRTTLKNLFRERFGRSRFAEWIAERVWRHIWEAETQDLQLRHRHIVWLVPCAEFYKYDTVMRDLLMWAHFYSNV